ncbi:MAG: response regulator [Lachnospiraceae bacterium]|uniref:Stage 0 sporulation protein A homolog n=1 Tax=Candidatus Weimeria bifida TaxID=2599074 RepID=A0A6N7J0W1_9FIRM|nr:response regulator [Candidatus Weimeria bifida]RRF96695.1 MAG: response regulator [Lachnospiraceae bacterium]
MLTVYIADDEVWVVLGLQKQLKKTGLAVKVVGSANNGLTARDEIGKLKPDIVFTDIRMPGENGLELLKDIGELSPDTRVVIISGYADFAYAQEAIRGNAYEYIVKPIHEEDLKNVLERIIKEINPEQTSEENQEEVKQIAHESAVSIADKAILEIQENYLKDISLSVLAEEYGVSAASLSSQLKEKLGMTYSDYVTSLRIQKAKELISTTSLSMQEVAEQSGYSDYFYFTKVFKKVEGISPSKYKKEL